MHSVLSYPSTLQRLLQMGREHVEAEMSRLRDPEGDVPHLLAAVARGTEPVAAFNELPVELDTAQVAEALRLRLLMQPGPAQAALLSVTVWVSADATQRPPLARDRREMLLQVAFAADGEQLAHWAPVLRRRGHAPKLGRWERLDDGPDMFAQAAAAGFAGVWQ